MALKLVSLVLIPPQPLAADWHEWDSLRAIGSGRSCPCAGYWLLFLSLRRAGRTCTLEGMVKAPTIWRPHLPGCGVGGCAKTGTIGKARQALEFQVKEVQCTTLE